MIERMAVAFNLLVLCCVFGLASGNNSTEWFRNISTNLFNLPGDIVLGGLFVINTLTSNLSDRIKPSDLACERYSKHKRFCFLKRQINVIFAKLLF